MLDYGRYDYDLWDVVRAEQVPTTGQTLKDEFEEYYGKNQSLLRAHRSAAQVINWAGLKVSARALTELARWLSYYWPVIEELVRIYAPVIIERGEQFKVPNVTSSGLTRYLERMGYDVTKAHSKMDEVGA